MLAGWEVAKTTQKSESETRTNVWSKNAAVNKENEMYTSHNNSKSKPWISFHAPAIDRRRCQMASNQVKEKTREYRQEKDNNNNNNNNIFKIDWYYAVGKKCIKTRIVEGIIMNAAAAKIVCWKKTKTQVKPSSSWMFQWQWHSCDVAILVRHRSFFLHSMRTFDCETTGNRPSRVKTFLSQCKQTCSVINGKEIHWNGANRRGEAATVVVSVFFYSFFLWIV